LDAQSEIGPQPIEDLLPGKPALGGRAAKTI